MSFIHKYYDQHTLYIESGAITEKKLEQILKDAFAKLKKNQELKENKIKLNTNYVMKIVTNKNGNLLGRAYLWVEDPQLYYILNSRNPDGSERIERKPNPNWNEFESYEIPPGVKWGDIIEEEPEILIIKPSLVQFSEYKYSESESEIAKSIIDNEIIKEIQLLFYSKLIKDGQQLSWDEAMIQFYGILNDPETGKSKYETYKTIRFILSGVSNIELLDLIEQIGTFDYQFNEPNLPKSHIIKVSGAYVTEVDETKIKNILTARVYPGKNGKLIIPDRNTLINYFLPYTTKTEYLNKHGEHIEYPIYNYDTQRKIVSLTFFERNRDAQFALLMNKKVEFYDPKGRTDLTLMFDLGKNFNAKPI